MLINLDNNEGENVHEDELIDALVVLIESESEFDESVDS